ncbi:BLUF domain-containing protein [Hymenobacter aquaticus]|uniref:BLUF domain-containing protein n=1 Tax=Hymenobacter aquaticus TaxID=1867101 RepID=A0A4Z0PTY9_9BACT|nr:BLUF domain-containing protein [Hymenobacter aquaticus]TGE20756.1 BLUF domain-containing protein [Hymenobacter aquaticus]
MSFVTLSLNLFHLCYQSRATPELDEEGLLALLVQSRTYNRQHAITGVLLYSENRFVQVLEGDEATVLALFERIRRDNRHTEVTLLTQESLTQRMFPDWSMGFSQSSHAELAAPGSGWLAGFAEHPATRQQFIMQLVSEQLRPL